MALARTHVQGLEQLRRDLRALGNDSGREFDKRAKVTANRVRDAARDDMPKRTGRSARSIVTSSTYKGIAVRSSLPQVRQHEFGAKLWLRRGLPYAKPSAGGMSSARGNRAGALALRQVPASPGRNGQARVVNEAQYLVPRRLMLNKAADRYAPFLAKDAERMIEDLKRRHHLS